MLEQFSRTALLFGDEAIEIFQKSKVAVMGLGGVGSYAAEALARSGIGSFLLVDFDTVGLSNLNRQLPALHSTIGKMKTEAMRDRILDINPQAEVEIYSDFCAQESRDFLLKNLDFVVDAIDSLGPKTGLLESCIKKEIPVISSMGAASRFDPAQIELVDISKSRICPLAKKVRKYLHRRGIRKGIPVIYSYEKPIPQFDHAAGAEAEWVSGRGRKRGTLGSVVYLPAIMGMWAASYVLRKLAGKF
ncbi:MAG: tRNA threonylcarbamoyladenosine dehydratase [Candidatus Cloacimonetes bacterium]|nr:tRNA threonylcarbamoyladenosine dehydratase [Candidatus Cloacimonadota bacterium]MCF7813484.1 tRNA threonylcarbamoyladenosine dehydratase [Candidatus Cloacimonadota bacterium]MCF7868593.1 tRNA threonylcarbamoyladenosine dehydratase [Candidatus Cloacimonadota bacterium]MCF7883380.1 tRNA threonylcarbamoyladenosine dehydratase [Candidatus Cloacimonadota bacterium]